MPALPGYKNHPGMNKVIKKTLKDLDTLERAGYNGILVENDGDHPPHIGPNAAITHHFSEVMKVILQHAKVPIGIEILYDMPGTVELAATLKICFVRLDVFSDSGKTPYGPIVSAEPEKIVNIKTSLNKDLILFTDIQVKHLIMLNKKTIKDSVTQAIKFGSDGIIITGTWTGKKPSFKDCIEAKKYSGDIPVLVGSGLSSTNAEKILSVLDGGIVATAIKNGDYIDLKKAKALVSLVNKKE